MGSYISRFTSEIAIFAVVVVLLFVRFLPSAAVPLVADDWPNMARAQSYSTAYEAVAKGLTDPRRPLSMAVLDAIFHVAGDRPWVYTAISIFGNVTLVLLTMAMTLQLNGSRLASCVAGLFLAVCPNLVETTHWSTQVVNEVLCALIWYVASGVFFIRYYRTERLGWLVASALCYGFGLFSYEAGLFLPAAFAVLLTWPLLSMRNLIKMLPFGLLAGFYAAWRMTNAFGLNTHWDYPPHMDAGLSLRHIIWNAWQLVHWWLGDHLLEAVWAGWSGFLQIPVWTRRGLLALNAIIAFVLYRLLRRVADEEPFKLQSFLPPRFARAWVLAACAPLLISYTASRLMVLPAVGLAMLAGFAASKTKSLHWMIIAAGLVFVSAGALQGTAQQYRQVGEFNRRLYAYLKDNKGRWERQVAVIFDTRTIRERQARRLLGPVDEHERTWAFYGNAVFFRGFVPLAMMKMIVHPAPLYPAVVHDVENGLTRYGDNWIWFDRYSRERSYFAPTGAVFYVDMGRIAQTL